jgi:hypothetical protein
VFEGITNLFKRINENNIVGANEEEKEIIEMAFKCMTHRIRKHIANKVGKYPCKPKEKLQMKRKNRRNPGMYIDDEKLEEEKEIRRRTEGQHTALSIVIGKMKELKKIMKQKRLNKDGYKILDIEEGTLGPDPDREIEHSFELMNRLELLILVELAKIDDGVFTGNKPRKVNDLEELCDFNDFDEK